jgi:phosphoglycerol transferase MdoB-like AlkP superfamily enzyme
LCSPPPRLSTPTDPRHHNLVASGRSAAADSGPYAFALFALGIIGTGLLAVPYWRARRLRGQRNGRIAGSLDAKPLSRRLFYGTIAATTLAGTGLSYTASTRPRRFTGRRWSTAFWPAR